MTVVTQGMDDTNAKSNSVATGSGTIGGSDANAVKLTDMFSRCASQSGWSGLSQNYLQAIRERIEDPSMPVKAKMHHIADDSVAFISDGNAVILVKDPDIVDIKALSGDIKFFKAKEAFLGMFPNVKIANIVSVNRFMYDRANQMTAYISQVLMSFTDEAINSFTVDSFTNQYQIHIDTDMSNVRQFFDANSTNPVICGDFGFIAQISNTQDRNQLYQARTPMFGVTGYVEFIRNEMQGVYTPLVHVTDILSVVPNPKILALALPLIAEVFIGRGLWRQPFTATGKTNINIGNLVLDPTTGAPAEVKNDMDFRKMFREFIQQPILCVDTRLGATSVLGQTKLTLQSDHSLLINDFAKFINKPISIDGSGEILGKNMFREIVGVIESTKSGKFNNLMDTRDLTYLSAVATLKWSQRLDVLLTRSDIEPIRRFDAIREIAGEITPTYTSITTTLLGDFLMKIAKEVAKKVTVDIPMGAEVPTIDVTDYEKTAYQSGINLFGPTGGGSAMSGGFVRW
jgi:hypothetical protein